MPQVSIIMPCHNGAKTIADALHSVQNQTYTDWELLSYFKNARYVITDTFHGTVLSLITESNFATFIRGNANKVQNLLSEYSLENRISKDESDCQCVLETKIDYASVNRMMNIYREKSNEYLNSILI